LMLMTGTFHNRPNKRHVETKRLNGTNHWPDNLVTLHDVIKNQGVPRRTAVLSEREFFQAFVTFSYKPTSTL